MFLKNQLVAVSVAVGLFAFVPAHAAISLQPGEWQETTTGLEDGKPVPPEVEKSCMTPEEARDAANVVEQIKTDMKSQAAGECQKLDIQQSGNTISLVMKCGDPKMMSFDITGTFTFITATRYTGTMKSAVTMGGKTMTQDKKIESVRIGECKPGQAKKK